MTLTNNHQQPLLLLDDVDLKDRSQARDVGQGVLNDIQRVQALFRAHQDYLRRSRVKRVKHQQLVKSPSKGNQSTKCEFHLFSLSPKVTDGFS